MSPKQSRTASPRQPVATKPLFKRGEFLDESARRSLSITTDIRDHARFYAEDPRVAGWYEYDWYSTGGSRYFQAYVSNADTALDAMAGFQFPAEISTTARRASRQLVGAFEMVARLQVQRHLTSGRLDRRKLNQVAMHTAAGTYDGDKIRPYRRSTPTPAELPTIAIVADGANTQMWGDSEYTPRVLALTLAIQWACEAAGLPAYSALCQGNAQTFKDYPGGGVYGTLLAAPGQVISPRTYGAALHRDLWRHSKMTLHTADFEYLKFHADQIGSSISSYLYGRDWTSRDGGSAVAWAQQTLGADFVIAIGDIRDHSSAIATLPTTVGIQDAVAIVAKTAQQLS